MANNKILINERQTELGNFIVGRFLPFIKKRQVGPFTFVDHMGPSQLGNGVYLDVDQHPHIGLSTLTYLFQGEIHHKDSLGSNQIIRPGDVGFMTSGSGVTHTERTPEFRRNNKAFTLHGYQIWVALPKALEAMQPRFDFYEKKDLITWKEGTLTFKLIAGKAFGKSSPLQGYSPLFMLDIFTEKAVQLNLDNQIKGEVAILIVKGSIQDDGEKVGAGQMLISKTSNTCKIQLAKDTRLLVFGGEPLEEQPLLLWNFVAYSKETLNQAKENWQNKKFPEVSEDDTYIPFPKAKM